QYTRPRSFRGLGVPEVLLSGNHEQIRLWRRRKAPERTWQRRPDLLAKFELDHKDRLLLAEIKRSAQEEGSRGS
ncbi:MAG: tRNA (guanosine(37)-N1)-methyltransferase TrmD, partial [Clostridia bacterium]|nr:tRNA (guanosine(37)-N1)-methyltransferase TrmD [Clostridia bacterium]